MKISLGFIKRMLLLCVVMITGQTASAQTWTPQTISGDSTYYYLMNRATNLFITEKGFSTRRPMAVLCVGNEDGTFVFENPQKTFLNLTIETNPRTSIINYGGASPKSVSCAINGEVTSFTVGGTEEGYTLSVKAEWKYGLTNKTASYTAYLTVNQQNVEGEDGATTTTTTLATTTNATAENNYWILVSPSEYAASAYAREDALERLNEAIAAAQELLNTGGPLLKSTTLSAQLTSAKATKASAESSYSWISSRVSVDDINNAAQKLEDAVADATLIFDYYNTCMEEIEEVNAIGGTAIDVACATAKAGLKVATSTSSMDNCMSILRLEVMAYFQLHKEFDDNTDFTGVLSNHSFETGTMRSWYHLKFNTSEIGGALGGIASGDLSGLGEIVSVDDFSEYSHPVRNEDLYAMNAGHKKYYYNTNIPSTSILSSGSGENILQPIIGLPNGEYRISALMNSNAGLLGTTKNYISVVSVKNSVLTELLDGVDIMNLTDMSYILSLIVSNMGTIIENSTIVYNSKATKNSNTFEEVSCDFTLEEASTVFVILNAGLLPLAGSSPFKADNVRLTYLEKIQVPGDVNVDGKFTIADVAASIELLNNPEAEGYKMKNGDMDKNGTLTISDVNAMGDLILEKK